jgi:GT2 family glycosyltransferase
MTRKRSRPVTHDQADIAVIIPAFNSGNYIDQALGSLACQTLQPSAVVVVDDCSTDDTCDRARSWSGRLPLEVVQLERNQGPGVARDRAIRVSTAPFLALLDADDFFLPDHLETMARAHAASPGLVSAQELSWYPGIELRFKPQPRRLSKRTNPLVPLLRHNFVNFGFFSRELYESVGGFCDLYFCEDWDLWIRMVRAGADLTVASHPTAVHRVHAQSLSFDAARIAQHGMSYLETAVHAAQSSAESAAARAGIQTLRAKLNFYQAIELAARGDVRQARQVALGAFPARGVRASAGLLAMALAPASAAWLEQFTRRYRIPDGGYAPAGLTTRVTHPPTARNQ